MDTTALYVQNLLEAFKQLNQFFGLALATSVSALALERRAPSLDEKPIETPYGIVPLLREDAQLVLLGIAFLAGLMGSYAAESAVGIVRELAKAPEILRAACTYPSVATAPVGVPVLAAVLPLAFAAAVFVRKWRRLREGGILLMLYFFAIPFVVVASMLASMPCRSS